VEIIKFIRLQADGTFCVSAAGNPVGSNSVEYLVVAGAGAGGGGDTMVVEVEQEVIDMPSSCFPVTSYIHIQLQLEQEQL
jgi:hypothetical protein